MKRRDFIQLTAAAGAGLMTAPSWAITPELDTNYKKVPQKVDIAPHKYSVVEVFGYTCPHCHELEPSLHDWLKTKPDNVHFQRMPAVFNSPNWIFMARVFYTSQELGVLDKAHNKFFDALHIDNIQITSVEDVADFYTQFGVKKEDFINTFKGFKVDQLVRNAAKLTRQYGIEGVPSVIVNGQFLTDVPMAKGKPEMWELVDKLTKL